MKKSLVQPALKSNPLAISPWHFQKPNPRIWITDPSLIVECSNELLHGNLSHNSKVYEVELLKALSRVDQKCSFWHFSIYTYIIDKKKEYFNHQNCHLFKKIICQPVCWWWPIFNALAASTQRQFNSMEDQPTVKTLSSLWGYCCDLWGQCNNKIQFLLILFFIFF